MRVTGRRAALSAADISPLEGLHPAPFDGVLAESTVTVRHVPAAAVSNTTSRSPASGVARHDEYGKPPAATSGGATRTLPDATHTTPTPTSPRKSIAVSPRNCTESDAAARSSDPSTAAASRNVRRASAVA